MARPATELWLARLPASISVASNQSGRRLTSFPLTLTLSRKGRGDICLSFQLFLELIEKAPVGALRNELLRSGFDHPHFTQPQSKEADAVLRAVLAPLPVGKLSYRLHGVLPVLH